MNTDELMAEACPLIQECGAAYYTAPISMRRIEECGLGQDGYRAYLYGRGGSMGDVECGVAASALGYFSPTLLEPMWTSALPIISPRRWAEVAWECCAEVGRAYLSDVAGLENFCGSAGEITAAADQGGLPLYAGFCSLALVDDLPGMALQLITLHRELRGSAHLLAVRSCGLVPKVAHFTHRPNYFRQYGWTEDDAPEVGPAQHEALRRAELLTDDLVRPAYSVLDGADAKAFLNCVRQIDSALRQAGWGGPGKTWSVAQDEKPIPDYSTTAHP